MSEPNNPPSFQRQSAVGRNKGRHFLSAAATPHVLRLRGNVNFLSACELDPKKPYQRTHVEDYYGTKGVIRSAAATPHVLRLRGNVNFLSACELDPKKPYQRTHVEDYYGTA
ncbi:unnamed protein product, partial [Iphiclides podalirius]